MALRPTSILAAAALLISCAPPSPQLPPAPTGLQRIVLEAPVNRTGAELVVDGPGLFERLIRERPATVPDILADDLRMELEERGFRVSSGKAGDVPILRTAIRRWEPFAADYSTVTVDIDATLVEPDGRELWSARRTNWIVSTTNARSRPEASTMASAAVAEALVGGWQAAGR